MTPKEKAKELFDKMQLDWACDSCHNDWTKECALIAVDYILNSEPGKAYFIKNYWMTPKTYWQEVKQEIEKL